MPWGDISARLNTPPTADFSYSPSEPTTFMETSFTSESSDPDGSIQSYYWEFGDGHSASVANPSHQYDSAGTYSVNLTVTDDKGATTTTTQNVPVSADGTATEDFESGLAGWTAVGGGITTTTNSPVYEGSYRLGPQNTDRSRAIWTELGTHTGYTITTVLRNDAGIIVHNKSLDENDQRRVKVSLDANWMRFDAYGSSGSKVADLYVNRSPYGGNGWHPVRIKVNGSTMKLEALDSWDGTVLDSIKWTSSPYSSGYLGCDTRQFGYSYPFDYIKFDNTTPSI